MSFVYTKALTKIGTGALVLSTSDMRVALVMTNTTADTEKNVEFMAGFTTLDEMNGAAYVRKALAAEAVNEDLPNFRAEFDATDVTWTAIGAGTRAIAGVVLFKFVTNDADSIPVAYIDSGGFPKIASGGDLLLQFNTEGIVQLASAA